MSEHKPGPEFNALLAEKVMGWHRVERHAFGGYHRCPANPTWYSDPADVDASVRQIDEWNPSTDIAAAWEVWEELERRGYHSVMVSEITATINQNNGQRDARKVYSCCFEHQDYIGRGLLDADTAPMAICLAALQAVQAAKGE